MTYIIVKPTRREREAQLAESRSKTSHRRVEGVVRTTEEAHDMARQREQEGYDFDKPYVVSGNAAESRQAEAEVLVRQGINPDTMQRLHSESTQH